MGMGMGMGMGLWTGRELDLGPGVVLARRRHGMDFPQGLGNDRADGTRMGSYLRLRGIAAEPTVDAESEEVPAGMVVAPRCHELRVGRERDGVDGTALVQVFPDCQYPLSTEEKTKSGESRVVGPMPTGILNTAI